MIVPKQFKKYHEWMLVQNRSKKRIVKVVRTLVQLTKLSINKKLKELTDEELNKLIIKIHSNPKWASITKEDKKIILKAYLKWVGKPKLIKKIKINRKLFTQSRKLPEELLIEDDVIKLCEATKNLMWRALIMVLWESGVRHGELLNMKIKDVYFDVNGSYIIVDGKTGMRRVRLVNSTNLLSQWLRIHPFRLDKNSPLWISYKNKALKSSGLGGSLKYLADKIGFTKPVNPHHWRHSRATFMANYLTESQLCEYFGWIQGSDMPRQYVHLSGRDVDNAVLGVYGLSDKKEVVVKLTPKKCPNCLRVNEAVAERCSYCGSFLDPRKFAEFLRNEQAVIDFLKELKKKGI